MSDDFTPLAPLPSLDGFGGLGASPFQSLQPLADLPGLPDLPSLPPSQPTPTVQPPQPAAGGNTAPVSTAPAAGSAKSKNKSKSKSKGKPKAKLNPNAPDFQASATTTNIKASVPNPSASSAAVQSKPKRTNDRRGKADKTDKRDKPDRRDKRADSAKPGRHTVPGSTPAPAKRGVLQDGRYQVSLSSKVKADMAALDESTSDDDNTCELCAESLEVIAVGSCNHRVCHCCSLRMRVLLKQHDCAICRAPLDKILLTDKLSATWTPTLGNGLRYEARWKAYVSSPAVHKTCQQLFSFRCQKCDAEPFSRWDDLRRHVIHQHDRHFCDLCVKHSTRFASEHLLYTAQELNKHSRQGDVNSPDGHPECRFCKKRKYDNDTLLKHLKSDHAHCTLCERLGQRFEYYANPKALDQHYRREHITCPHKCKMVAFLHEIELQQHIVEQHMNESSQLDRAKARSLDPSAFFNMEERRSHRSKQPQSRGPSGSAASRRAREAQEADQANHPSMHVPAEAPSLEEAAAFPTLGDDSGKASAKPGPKPKSKPHTSSAAQPPPQAAAAPTPRFASALAGPNFANSSDPVLGNAAAAPQASWPALSQRAEGNSRTRPTAPTGGYIHPPRFKERNGAMVDSIKQAVGSADAFEEFRSLSAAFRSNEVTAEEYYLRCSQLLGARFNSIYPELVALLPSLAMQSALVDAFDRHRRPSQVQSLNISTRGAKPKVTVSRAKGQGAAAVTWNRCARCGQVLQPQDTKTHAAAHSQELEADFPSLAALGPRKPVRGRGKQKPTSGAGAWGRR
eukprot:m.238202 g.238202  ORF g.238202 m.238202 type:complete len:793 (+) comp17426_c0_seq5:270-2648(+)